MVYLILWYEQNTKLYALMRGEIIFNQKISNCFLFFQTFFQKNTNCFLFFKLFFEPFCQMQKLQHILYFRLDTKNFSRKNFKQFAVKFAEENNCDLNRPKNFFIKKTHSTMEKLKVSIIRNLGSLTIPPPPPLLQKWGKLLIRYHRGENC